MAGEVMHKEQPPNRKSFYDVVDTMIRVILAGLGA
jgi:hypothetical protein